MPSDARDGVRDALRAPLGKLSILARVILWVQLAFAFALYFLLGNFAAYLLSLLTYQRWDGGLALAGIAGGVLAGLIAARNAYLRFADDGDDSHGSARFAYVDEVRADLVQDSGLIVGRELRGKKLLRYDGPAHLLTIAPTRSGKGVGLVVPTLLTWPGSCVVHDIKGENWTLTAGWRQRFGRVALFDPTNLASSAYNPLLEVRRGVSEVRDVQNIADILVDPEGSLEKRNHWEKTSHALLVGAMGLLAGTTLPYASRSILFGLVVLVAVIGLRERRA